MKIWIPKGLPAALVLCLGLVACETSKTHGPDLEQGGAPRLDPDISGSGGSGGGTAGRSSLVGSAAAPARAEAPATTPGGVEKRGKATIGAPAPDFALKDVHGKPVRLSDFKGKTVVLEWFSPTCPYSVFAWGEKGPLRELTERMRSEGIVWLTINSEDPATAAGEPERTRRFAAANEMNVAILIDPAGTVGRTYEAKSTPHMYVISPRGVLVYRGALDNAPLGKVKDAETKRNYVEAAIDDVKAGHAVTAAETKPYG